MPKRRGNTRKQERTVTPQAASEAPEVPEMTPALAEVFAKLLSVGCPPFRAVLYVVPQLDADTAKATERIWMHDERVQAAMSNLLGGAWIELPPEKRYQIALDKHFSEMAFFLYATNFNEVEHKEGLEKMKQAREVLGQLTGRKVDEADPMQAFARFALDLTKAMAMREADKKRPPHLQTPKNAPEMDLLAEMAKVTGARES